MSAGPKVQKAANQKFPAKISVNIMQPIKKLKFIKLIAKLREVPIYGTLC